MGGLGSGSWRGRNARATVESYHSLNINLWNRQGCLQPGHLSTWAWSRAGTLTATLSARTEPDAIELSYGLWPREPLAASVVHERVRVTWTACHYGGRRPWFACACGRRAAKLYVVRGSFRCRLCHDLVYRSQRERLTFRLLRKAQRIRHRLRWQTGEVDFHAKPKRMHGPTYARLCKHLDDAEQTASGLVALRWGLLPGFSPKQADRHW